MSRYDFLASFLAVYRTKSLTRAAQELELSQPAISTHLKSLEAAVGKPLFTRGPRGAEPTAAAHDLADAVSPSLDTLDAAWVMYQRASSKYGGPVYIGAESELLTYYLLPKLATLENKKITSYFALGEVQKLMKRLEDRTLDMLVYHTGYQAEPELNVDVFEQHTLSEDNLLLVGNAKWADKIDSAALQAGETRALLKAQWIVYAIERNFPQQYLLKVFDQREEFDITAVIPDVGGMLEALKQGLGIGVLPDFCCHDAVMKGDLFVLHQPTHVPTVPINLISLKPSKLSTLAAQVRRHLQGD